MVNDMCSLVIIEMRPGFEAFEARIFYHTVFVEHL